MTEKEETFIKYMVIAVFAVVIMNYIFTTVTVLPSIKYLSAQLSSLLDPFMSNEDCKECELFASRIGITKNCVDGTGATFNFTVTGPNDFRSAVSLNCGRSVEFLSATSGSLEVGDYTVTESASLPTGWSLTSGSPCTVTLTETRGQSPYCTITNNYTELGSILITKLSFSPPVPFTFSGTGPTPFTVTFTPQPLSGTDWWWSSTIVSNLNPGEYTVRETVPAGWTLEGAYVCSVTVSSGRRSECSNFTNRRVE